MTSPVYPTGPTRTTCFWDGLAGMGARYGHTREIHRCGNTSGLFRILQCGNTGGPRWTRWSPVGCVCCMRTGARSQRPGV